MLYQCQNCAVQWEREELNGIRDLFQRVEYGEPMPAGECPECGALCHAVDPNVSLLETLREIHDDLSWHADDTKEQLIGYIKDAQRKALAALEGKSEPREVRDGKW